MIKYYRTTFDESIKLWTWPKFRESYSKNAEFMRMIAGYGKTLEEAYTEITGKKIDVRTPDKKVHDKPKGD